MSISEPSYSISDKAFDRCSTIENLQRLRDVGFTHIHFSHHWTKPDELSDEAIAQWQAALGDTGMRVLDVHGCHPPGLNLWVADEAVREAALKLFRHRLQVTRNLGGDAMAYHVPCHVEPTPEVLALFLDGLARVEDLARELGVAVALENHYDQPSDQLALTAAFEKFDQDFIGFTFDPGHAMMSGNFDWLVQNCIERLKILHLNDNNGREDRHWNPFTSGGLAHWGSVVEAIAGSPYQKPIQLEVQWREERHDTHEDFLRCAMEAAKRLTVEVSAARG